MNTTPQTLIAHLRNAETNNVGFSYNINNGDSNPDHGYMVSRAGHEEIVPQGADLVAYGKHYFLRHAETLAEDNAYMGCWFDGSNFVFDISENIQFLETAIQLGETNNQQAIWDCASGSEYRLVREGDDTNDYKAMLDTLGVAMDEFAQLHNHARIDGMDVYYQNHMAQLDKIHALISNMI
jgi:hypothetical protein